MYDFQYGFSSLIDFINENKEDPNVFALDYSDIVRSDKSVLRKLQIFLGVKDLRFEVNNDAKSIPRIVSDNKKIKKISKVIDENLIAPVDSDKVIKNSNYLGKIIGLIPERVFTYFGLIRIDIITQFAVSNTKCTFSNMLAEPNHIVSYPNVSQK